MGLYKLTSFGCFSGFIIDSSADTLCSDGINPLIHESFMAFNNISCTDIGKFIGNKLRIKSDPIALFGFKELIALLSF